MSVQPLEWREPSTTWSKQTLLHNKSTVATFTQQKQDGRISPVLDWTLESWVILHWLI